MTLKRIAHGLNDIRLRKEARITAARVTLERLRDDAARKQALMHEASEAYAKAVASVATAAAFLESLEDA
jgi:hypothetical protein